MGSIGGESLIVGNITQRPVRAMSSMAGVALGMVLILVTAGLARAMLDSRARRESIVGAEILFQPPGGFAVGVSTRPLLLPAEYASAIARIEDVQAATPVGRLVRKGAHGLGFELIEGVVVESTNGYSRYSEATGIRIVSGRRLVEEHDMIVDKVRAGFPGEGLGAVHEILGQDFRVVGIYEPELGARVKIPLRTMQELLGSKDKCSWILVKCTTPEVQESVAARIIDMFPDQRIIFTRDIPALFQEGLYSIDVFLTVVIGLAVTVSSLIILLAMNTAVTARTREIGILKSLGAPKLFVATMIAKEALLMAIVGICLGIMVSYIVGEGITELTTLSVEIELRWIMITSSLSIISSLIGAMYPAFRAATMDPVAALARR